MQNDYSKEGHLSKDELMEILNDIDTEHSYDRKDTKEHRNKTAVPFTHPNPNNQFY